MAELEANMRARAQKEGFPEELFSRAILAYSVQGLAVFLERDYCKKELPSDDDRQRLKTIVRNFWINKKS